VSAEAREELATTPIMSFGDRNLNLIPDGDEDIGSLCVATAFLHGKGRVLALDDPETLQRSLPGAVLEVRADDPRAARDALRTSDAVRRASLFGDTVHALVDAGAREDAVRRVLSAAGVAVEEVRAVEASLEDVFIERVAGSEAGDDEGGEGGRG